MTDGKVCIGVVGCGNISGIYFKNLTTLFDNVKVVACGDLIPENAKSAAEKYGIEKIMTLEEMLSCPDIDLILNLTTPPAHFSICMQCIKAGKHVYVEKPLSLSLEEGKTLMQAADDAGLLVGCAPDTFLGGGIQTCASLIKEGRIGEPIGAVAYMMCHGHESWHPNPAFYYKRGGGPMFDMGPYYLTALLHLVGPFKKISAMDLTAFPQRTITSNPHFGEKIDVEVATHVNGLIRFENGAVGNIITSFDVWASSLPNIEIYGTKGSLRVPDPNTFGGKVLLADSEKRSFEEIEVTASFTENSRGLGVSRMADCILGRRGSFETDGHNALHVLEAICALAGGEAGYDMTTRPLSV